MKKVILKIILTGLIITTLFSCGHKSARNNASEETVIIDFGNDSIEEVQGSIPQIPQITNIKKSPDRLTKEVKTYTVTLITEGERVKLEDTEFSLDGKEWQKTGEFKDVKGGKYTFYARNKRDKSLQNQKEMYFEPFVEVSLPTIPQLNELLKQIADCDDKASDELRKFSKSLPVHGVANISNIEQLIRDACTNGIIYVVQKIETGDNGNLAAIIIYKK